jgi:hypothetical protein
MKRRADEERIRGLLDTMMTESAVPIWRPMSPFFAEQMRRALRATIPVVVDDTGRVVMDRYEATARTICSYGDEYAKAVLTLKSLMDTERELRRHRRHHP